MAGVVWYQGESEASPSAAPKFPTKFEEFVAAVRRDFGQPDLPFYYVQIGRHIDSYESTRMECRAGRATNSRGTRLANTGVVSGIDCRSTIGIHVGTQGLKRLGARMANVATRKSEESNVVSARFTADDRQFGIIRVKFANVTGSLRATEGSRVDFLIHTRTANGYRLTYRADVDPSDGARSCCSTGGKLPEDAVLHYGFGKDPYCNLGDEADMAALVFGPLTIQR